MMGENPAAGGKGEYGDENGIATTVTYLELIPPGPRREPLPLGQPIALMRATEPPLHFYRYMMFRTGRPWHWVWRLRRTDEELRAIIHAETTDLHVLYLAGAPAGFFEIDRSEPDATNIAYFGLMEHAYGRGLGRWFLCEAIHAALETKPAKVTVNTCTLDHPAALPLYQKLGFVPVGREETAIRPLSEAELLRLSTSN
ncbi:MAG: GNAT family N-acetyltransferase [Rhizobiaceae bacterium]|nr:GNAT family N-acetyltransferase [Rhizobiaceae bacterium]